MSLILLNTAIHAISGNRNGENGNEEYVCGLGVAEFKCKRDNPNWKPLTKQQLIELYKQMPDRTNISIGELLEGAIIDGIVEGNNDGISIQKNGTGDS